MLKETFENLRPVARVVGFVAIIAVAALSIALASHIRQMNLPTTATIMHSANARSGCSGRNLDFVTFARIPPLVRNALLAAEEPDFFAGPQVHGYLKVALISFSPFSGSIKDLQRPAISMGVVRCLLHAHRERWRNGDWHLANVVLLKRIEREVEEERIFEIFANDIYFGRASFGIVAASKTYFGKSLDELSFAEAATIAAAVRAPGELTRSGDALIRRNFVLDRMAEAGFVARDLLDAAKATPVNLVGP